MEYYLYDESGFYTETVEADEKPKNGFEFPPPGLLPMHKAWFDGYGWRMVPDTHSKALTLEEARTLAYDMLSQVSFHDSDYDNYADAERMSFDAQYAEAKAMQDGAEPGIYIKAISKATEEDADLIALKILDRRAASDQKLAEFAAYVQVLRNRIASAKTKAELPTFLELKSYL